MELILNGRFTNEYQEKTVELNGNPVKYMLAILDTVDGRMPITIWGDRKVGFAKDAIQSGNEVKIIVSLLAKPQTYTNSEGQSVTVPNVQLKLFSFVGIPHKTQFPPPPQPRSERVAPWQDCYGTENRTNF